MILYWIRLLNPFPFLVSATKAVTVFCWHWFKSRRFLRLLAAFPAVALAVTFVWAIAKSIWTVDRAALLDEYLSDARAAMARSEIPAAKLFFRRAEQLDPGNTDIKLEYARALYEAGQRSDAYQMLLTLAPIRKTGLLPAHRFLAEHPPEGSSMSQDYFRAIHLSHLVKASGATRAERNLLLQLLARYGRFSDAETLIQASLKDHPEDRLLLAQLKSASGDLAAAKREATLACEDLSQRLKTDPKQHEIRMSLAQAQVMVGQFSEAVETLCDGIQLIPQESGDSARFQKSIVKTYLGWLSTLPLEAQVIQRQCLFFMITETSSTATNDLFAPAFESKLTDFLESQNGRWMLPAIHGNALAASGDFSGAETLFREAHQAKQNDPVVANNLAWVILQTAQSEKDRPKAEVRLSEALSLCDLATSRMPDIASFVETRAQVSLALGRSNEALRDFKKCRELGMSTDSIEAAIRTLENRENTKP